MVSWLGNFWKTKDWEIIKEYGRAGLTTEGEGEVSTLGSIHLDTPSLVPVLDTGEMLLDGRISDIRVEVTSEDTGIVSKGS